MAITMIGTGRPTILVTGADQHQGLAVIRALGMKDLSVIACGAGSRSLGCHSRYASSRFTYASPLVSKTRFIADMLSIIRRTKPTLILPSVESTLIALDECRHEFEPSSVLAVPSSDVLSFAIDKSKTMALAKRVGVPAPATVRGKSCEEMLARAGRLSFPVAVKPQGHRLYAGTAHEIGFKVRYARTLADLRQILAAVGDHLPHVLVQQCIRGVGICVAAVASHGATLALFAYKRLREQPFTGGVSVLRESIPLDERLRRYVVDLLTEIKWHGVAMVEFKYDPREDRYTLMEINGRFQASTALSLDAGINFPSLVVGLYLDGKVESPSTYVIGVRERWLRGDLQALYGYLIGDDTEPEKLNPLYSLPSKREAVINFLRDFHPGMKYDEFKLCDWKPAVLEGLGLGMMIGHWLKAALIAAARLTLKAVAGRLEKWRGMERVAPSGPPP
jgi:predicted ATP-grasp superfamily ATP-dependent carboligase